MFLIATVIDTSALLQTAAASLAAGVGLTIAFSVAIWGAVSYSELREDGQTFFAIGAGIVMVIALLISLGGAALGIAVMLG